jgi:hypothetical protein
MCRLKSVCTDFLIVVDKNNAVCAKLNFSLAFQIIGLHLSNLAWRSILTKIHLFLPLFIKNFSHPSSIKELVHESNCNFVIVLSPLIKGRRLY